MQYPSSAQLQNLAPSFILGGVRLDIIHTSRRKRRGCLTSSVISACCANISIETSIFFCPRVKKIYQGSEIEPPQKSPLSWPPDLGLVARPRRARLATVVCQGDVTFPFHPPETEPQESREDARARRGAASTNQVPLSSGAAFYFYENYKRNDCNFPIVIHESKPCRVV